MNGKDTPARSRNEPERAVELRVHGIGGSTPEALLGVPSELAVARVAGGGPTSFYARRADPYVEGYLWGKLSTESPLQPLWLLLLPFILMNVAGWSHQPAGAGWLGSAWLWLHKQCVRLLGLLLTALAVAWLSLILVDLVAWQWGAGWEAMLPSWLGWLTPPQARVGLGCLVVLALILLATVAATRSQAGFEAVKGPGRGCEGARCPGPLGDPTFWERGLRAIVLLRWHVGVALLAWALIVYLAREATSLGPAPATLELGRLTATIGSGQIALLLGLLLLDLLGAAGRLAGRTGTGHRWPKLRDGYRLLAPTVLATLAAAVANAGGAGIAQFLDGFLDLVYLPDDNLVQARSELALLDVGGLTVLALLVAMLVALAWHVPVSGKAVGALKADYGLNDAPPAHPVRGLPVGKLEEGNEDLRFARTVARGRRLANLGRNLDLALALPTLLFLALGVVVTWVRVRAPSGPGVIRLPSFDGAADAIPFVPVSAEGWLRGLGAWVLVTGAGLAIALFRVLLLQRSGRQMLGFFWDVLTFWPRHFHPLAVRPYAERAVPELQHRIDHHLHHSRPPAALLLSTHSQGTVLAVAALLARPGFRERVALVTMGSPLAQLYARFFPAYFGLDGQYERLRGQLATANPDLGARAWSSFFHRTDYVGKEVFGDGSDTELPDPARENDPEVPSRDPGPDPPREGWTSLARHGEYWRERQVAERGDELRALLTGQRGRPAPGPPAASPSASEEPIRAPSTPEMIDLTEAAGELASVVEREAETALEEDAADVVRLITDSQEYRDLIERGPEGFILNMASASNPVLHTTKCPHISSLRPALRWAGKAYATDAGALERWARTRGGTIQRCPCAPLGA